MPKNKENNLFLNRRLLIATKHKKEKVLSDILEKELGVFCYVDQQFDTDLLGTFTGEVPRNLNPVDNAREKCLNAMELNDCDLCLASEGSFGPHPNLFFINADEEFLILIDKLNNLEIVAKELNPTTNFNCKEVTTESDLLDFAKSTGFPNHALILRNAKEGNTEIYKGINDVLLLKRLFNKLKANGDGEGVIVETDMRAMHNPTRMSIIRIAAEKLVNKIKSTCPECKTPGFDIEEVKKGLICSLCELPTNSILSYLFVCKSCGFSKEQMYPKNKKKEDPMYCNYCNP